MDWEYEYKTLAMKYAAEVDEEAHIPTLIKIIKQNQLRTVKELCRFLKSRADEEARDRP